MKPLTRYSWLVFALLGSKGITATAIAATEAAGAPAAATASGNSAGAESEEAIFLTLARDPYTRHYGHEPGEGWIPMPGTRTELKFSGFIQLNLIHDFQNAGFPYGWFVPGAIPVPTDHTPNTEFDTRTSRVTFETRTNTEEVGSVNTVVDIDFFGNISQFSDSILQPRLRQAYVTWVGPRTKGSFTAGYTWSTFLDLGVWPEIFDLQGPASMSGLRAGLVRGSFALGKEGKTIVDVSLEQPNTAVQQAADAEQTPRGIKDIPGLAARVNWQRDWGHLQVAGIVRQLTAENADGEGRDSAFGGALSLSGTWLVPGTKKASWQSDNLGTRQDRLQFQVQGGPGTGWYIFDTASVETGQDAVYDEQEEKLEALDQFGWFVGYHRWWTTRLRSQFVYGVEDVDNLDIQSGDSYDRAVYVLANLFWRAFNRMDIGLEYNWGQRRNFNGQEGEANRILLGLNFGF